MLCTINCACYLCMPGVILVSQNGWSSCASRIEREASGTMRETAMAMEEIFKMHAAALDDEDDELDSDIEDDDEE